MRRVAWLAPTAAAFAFACASGGSTAPDALGTDAVPAAQDALPADTGPPAADGAPDAAPSPSDAAPEDAHIDAGPDAGPAICATSTHGCTRARDCMPELMPPSNCAACVPYDRALCVAGSCSTPAPLLAGDVYEVEFQIPAGFPSYSGFAAYVVGARAVSGLAVGCQDVYAGNFDVHNACYDVLDTRGYDVGQPGSTFTISFTGFAGGVRALFVIYAYADANQSGQRLGVSCTEAMIEAPGGGRQRLAGGPLTPI